MYKYFGIEEGDGIQHGKMNEKIRMFQTSRRCSTLKAKCQK